MPRPKGGPKFGGRKKGTRNKKTYDRERLQRDMFVIENETPLDMLLRFARNTEFDIAFRGEMAKAAAPYLHARVTPERVIVPIQVNVNNVERFDWDGYGKLFAGVGAGSADENGAQQSLHPARSDG